MSSGVRRARVAIPARASQHLGQVTLPLCFILGFLICEMGIKKPPNFTVEGTKYDTRGKAPGTWQSPVKSGGFSPWGKGRGRRRCRVGAGRSGRQTGTPALGGRGRGAPCQPPRPSWCQNPAGSEPGSEEDTPGPRLQAAPGGPGLPAPPRPPALPHPLTYRPSRALQHRRLSHGRPPGRPWKLLPAGTTSGQAAPSLAVRAGAGRRPRVIGWRPRHPRNATGLRVPAGLPPGGPSASGACGERRARGREGAGTPRRRRRRRRRRSESTTPLSAGLSPSLARPSSQLPSGCALLWTSLTSSS